MGTAEEETSSKPSKAMSSVQETPTTMPTNPDWSSSTQAYYGNRFTPFFASPVAFPAPHPYMWGGQHPMMPSYGTPVHYPALYPSGGVYAHPNIGMAANITTGAETDGKNSDVKGQTCARKSKGNSNVGSEKAAETRNATSASENEGASQSVENGTEDSSNASDENNNQQESSSYKGSFDQMLVDGANPQNSAFNASILNTGMDMWNASSAGVSSAFVPAMVGREGLMPDHHLVQFEREVKRQRRRQANRESARRSRLRKQEECRELQQIVESLDNENSTLRDELERLGAECEKLTSENDSIKEELTRLCGPDPVTPSGLREKNSSGEGNS